LDSQGHKTAQNSRSVPKRKKTTLPSFHLEPPKMDQYRYHRQRSPKKSRKLLKIFLGILIVAGLIAWYQYSKYRYNIETPVDPTNTTDTAVIIKTGENLNSIADKLIQKDLVLDGESFKTYVKWNDFDRKIIAGRFVLNKGMNVQQIVGKITDVKQGEASLTIPEGSTIKDIDQKLVNTGLIQAGEFIQATKNFQNYKKYSFLDEAKIKALPYPLEGYLFPDTYFLDGGHFNNEDLIDLMLKNFQKKLPEEMLNPSGTSRSLYDVITMASMVEKEVRTDKDLPVVAGILWKRLDDHWQLGADATLLYLKNDRTIGQTELQADSPYNTRRVLGLPPGPISNPGLKSILAALHPQESAYFYYLTKPETGEVVYAKTNDEQNVNKAKYLN
jgi:UPF0755 protein